MRFGHSGKPLVLRSRPTRSRARVAEAIALIKRAWTQESACTSRANTSRPIISPHYPSPCIRRCRPGSSSSRTSPYGVEARRHYCPAPWPAASRCRCRGARAPCGIRRAPAPPCV